MTWQFFIGLSVVLYSVSVLLQRLILRESNSQPVAYAILGQLITGGFITVVGFAFADMTFPDLKPLLVNLLIMTLLYAFANVFIFRCLKTTEASTFTVIFATRALFTILASAVVLQEVLTGKQFMGAALVFLGVVLVSWKATKLSWSKGELLALAGAVCFGLANTNDRYLLQYFGVYAYMGVGFLAPGVLMAMMYPKETGKIKLFLKGPILAKIALLSVTYAFGAVTFFEALKAAPSSSQVAVVNLTGVIVTVLLSIVFLKERDRMAKKIAGAVAAFVGLWLIS